MYCMKCGAPNDDSARFCIKCGTALVQVRATPPQPPPQTVRPVPYQPPPARPERRGRVPRWLVTVGVVLLALLLLLGAALVGAYFWLGFHRANQTAKIVPADTPLMISLSPDPRQALRYGELQNLRALLPIFGEVPELRETSEQALSDLEVEFDIDFQEDVLPWIGAEVSLAMMDTEPVGYGDVPPIILAVATRSERRSDAFLEKVWQAMEQEGARFGEEVYQGTRVTYQVPEYEGAFAPAFATFDHLVVVGADRSALHQSIDTASTGGVEVLADQETFEAILSELPTNRLGYVFVNGEAMVADLVRDTGFPMQTQALLGLGASLGLADGGVRVDYVVTYDRDLTAATQQPVLEQSAQSLRTAQRVPGNTLGFLAGQDLYASWEAAASSLEDVLGLEYLLDEIEDDTGVHLADDLLYELTGEFALVALPDPSGLLGDDDVPFGLLFMAEAEDPSALESGIGRLVRTLETEGAGLRRDEFDGETFVLLEDPWGEWTLGYGFVDGFLVIGTSAEMLRAAVRGSELPLADESTYKAAARPIPERAGTYLFVNVHETVRAVYRSMDEWSREDFDEELQPYLEPIEAVSLGIVPRDEQGISRGTLFLCTETE